MAGDLRGFWLDRRCRLARMSLGQVLAVYLRHPAIAVYLALAVGGAGAAVGLAGPSLAARSRGLAAAVAATLLAYPLAEYLLHRFLLHGRFLYRRPWTVALWRRIHHAHHEDPDDLRVLFGALPTTLPPIVAIALPLGGLLGGAPGAAAALATGAACMLVYEFCHTVDHLPYAPRRGPLRELKRRHLLHHFHNEQGNFGITSFVVDRLVGSGYASATERPRSPTAFNLGYVGEERVRYPWLARLGAEEGRSA